MIEANAATLWAADAQPCDTLPSQIARLLDASVTGFTVSRVLEAGVTADAAVFALEYAGVVDGPTSIVLKYAKIMEASRELAQSASMYEKEVTFYTELYDEVSKVVPVPKLYGTFVDPDKPKEYFCIAMENLTEHSHPLEQVAGVSAKLLGEIGQSVAKLHATYWEHPMLKEDLYSGGDANVCRPWWSNWLDTMFADPECIDRIWKIFKNGVGLENTCIDVMPDKDMHAMVRLWKEHGRAMSDEMTKVLSSRPKTLLHGDLRSDNLFQSHAADGFTIIDWQTLAAGPPGLELVQFLSGSLGDIAE